MNKKAEKQMIKAFRELVYLREHPHCRYKTQRRVLRKARAHLALALKNIYYGK